MEDMELSKKRTYPSAAQKARLIELLDADEELRRGKFSSTFTKKEGERRWGAIAGELNSIPGSKREWKEWRKTWQDMKAAAKKRSAACRFSAASTGGGPPAPPMSDEHMAVLKTMSSSAVFGHTDSNESVVQFEDLPNYGYNADKVIVLDHEDHSKPPSAVNPPAAAIGIAVELHEDVPGTSSMYMCAAVMDETQTGHEHMQSQQRFEATADEDKTGSSASDKEMPSSKRHGKVPRRRAAVRRLEQSLAVSNEMQNMVQKKYELKKRFYEDFLNEMRAQSQILKDISQKLWRFDSPSHQDGDS